VELAALFKVTRQTVYNWEKGNYPDEVRYKLVVIALEEEGDSARVALIRNIKLTESVCEQLGTSYSKTKKELERLLNELSKGE